MVVVSHLSKYKCRKGNALYKEEVLVQLENTVHQYRIYSTQTLLKQELQYIPADTD